MSKKRSLFIQSLTAINECFSYRYDKHSSKHITDQPEQSWRIQAYYQKQYQHYLDKGYSPDKADRTAKNDCCVRLGHGTAEKRVDIVNIYLGAKS